MSIHVGTAPDSWGVWMPSDPRQTPWQRFLDEVAEADYSAIELGPFGYLPTDPQSVSDELARRSLQLAGGTIAGDLSAADAWQSMRATTASVCNVLEPLGARFLVLLDSGHPDSSQTRGGPPKLDEPGWQRLCETVHRLGEYTASRGIAAVFHPHADTAIQFEPDIEEFLALTDPSLVNLCLDVGHHAYAGGDAVRFFRDHHTRIPYLHLKDVDPRLSERARVEGWGMGRAVAEGAFVDLGKGCVDFHSLNRVVGQVDFDGWGIVEQDMFPAPFDKPLPIARRNRQYLRDTGLG
ncbi:MAG: sugar phosphate isomerase/epimerase [Chloroflexota bacterium]|nr:sugar phosphate isomerase/epimerase [Chloroflexota bacterium]